MRPGRLVRFVRFAAPSAGAAMAAVVAAGLIEGYLQLTPLAAVLCGTGGAALLGAPLLLLLSLAGRGLWLAWRPQLVPGPGVDGGRLFGAAVYALLAVLVVGAVGFAAAYLSLARGPSAELDPLVIGAALAVAVVFLLAASRSSVRRLARVAGRLGLGEPRAALTAVVVLAGILASVVWFGVAGPALSKVDYDLGGYGWTALLVLIVAHRAAGRLRGRRLAIAGAGVAVAFAGLIASTVTARLTDPATLFDAWYSMPVGGLAIGLTFDVDALRRGTAPADLAPRARPGAPHPDVVVVTIDTVRADALRLYGGKAATPALERLAARGRRYEWAFSPSNNTRQSVSSMMTGLSPARLRGRVIEFGLKLDPRHVVLGERFHAAGYATAGFLCCPNHLGGRKKIGLDRGLDTVGYQRRGDLLAGLAVDWLRASAGEARPRYVWIHLFEPHDWQRQDDGDRGDDDRDGERGGAAAAARYRRTIERADGYLGSILDAVDAGGRPTIVVVASDHGEGLGERGSLHHASNLYDSQIRVPLVVAGPGIGAGERIEAPVGLLDLAPTLLDLAGFDPPGMPTMDARSFARRPGDGGPGGGEAYAVMVRDRSVPRSGSAMVAGRYKLIDVDGRKPELYDLAADPSEAKNLASEKPDLIDDLWDKMDRRRAIDEEAPF